MFRFAFDEAIYAYAIVPLLGAFLWYALGRRRLALRHFGETHLVRRLARSVSHRGRIAKMMLLVLAVALLVTALARPQFGTRVETVRREGLDVVVALDLSLSMLAEDIQPSRLEKAKLAVSRLIDRLDGDRIGLVAFAGEAFVQSPLTVDYAAAKLFLNAMGPDLVPVQGTNLGQALTVALDMFDPEHRQDRVLIVITDGEDHEGEIDAALDRAVKEGVIIYTVGVGSIEGVPIPAFDAAGHRRGFERDAESNVVTTSLDEATLARIAQQSGGEYFRATIGGGELNSLAEAISGRGGREIEAQQVTQFEEQYQIFLGLALVLLVGECFVPDRRRVEAAWHGRFQ